MDQKYAAFMLQAEFMQGVRKTYCLQAIYDLRINNILNEANDFMSTEEICSKISGKAIVAKYLEKTLSFLASYGVFEERVVNDHLKFKTTEFLKLDELLFQSFVYPIDAKFMDLLEGKTGDKSLFEHVQGYNFWDLLTKEPYNSNFLEYGKLSNSMLTHQILPKLIDEIRKEGKENAIIMDVGGNTGKMSEFFHQNFPKMKCINFDLSNVISAINPIDGVEMIAGDMFKVETLPHCDILMNKSVLHDWSDEECITILKNFHKVIADDGLLLTVDQHQTKPGDIGPETWYTRGGDMLMMELFFEGGWRSKEKYEKLHEKAGFKVKRYVVLSDGALPVAALFCEKLK